MISAIIYKFPLRLILNDSFDKTKIAIHVIAQVSVIRSTLIQIFIIVIKDFANFSEYSCCQSHFFTRNRNIVAFADADQFRLGQD